MIYSPSTQLLQRRSLSKLNQENPPPEKSKFLTQVKISSAQKKVAIAGIKSHRINLSTIARQPEDNRYKDIDSKSKSSFGSHPIVSKDVVTDNEMPRKMSCLEVFRQKRKFSVNHFQFDANTD
jgi:hypothetical protein